MKMPILDSKYLSEEFVKTKITDNIKSACDSIYSSKIKDEEDEQKRFELSKEDLENYYEYLLSKQYMNKDIEEVIKKHGEKEVINTLKKIIEFKEKYEGVRIRTIVSEDEIEEFINYAKDYELEDSTIPLNAKNFLKICRVCYDAAPVVPFPKFISDYYIYAFERGSSIDEDHTVTDPKCYESDVDFREHYPIGAYHFEEIRFGGPTLNLRLFNRKLKVGGKYKNVRTWNGWFDSKTYDSNTCGRTIKMYNALRRNGYPITMWDPYETLKNYLGSLPNDDYGYKYFNSVEEARKAIEGKK